MIKFKKLIGVFLVFILCIVTFASDFKSVEATSSYHKLIQTADDELPFPVTIRDFKYDNIIFEPSNSIIPWLGKNMVESSLTSSSKPIFTEETIKTLAAKLYSNRSKLNAVSGKLKGLGSLSDAIQFYESNLNKSYSEISPNTDKSDNRINTAYRYIYYHLNKLFLDTNELSTQDSSVITSLPLKLNNDGTYAYTNSSFFPMDNKGFKNQGNNHNYHFTLESHTNFWFEKGKELTFNFTGDDDVWVYINGILVIDIGGIHGAESQSITIKPNGEVYNNTLKETMTTLPKSGWYSFDFFFMERHTTQSNLNITTNMVFKPDMGVKKEAYMIKDQQEVNADKAYPGETIYYKFGMTNTGNVKLNDIEFEDEKLGIKISKNGVYKLVNGQYETYAYNDLTIIKKNSAGQEIDTNISQLDKLESLEMGESILVKSTDFLKYEVTDSDAIGENPEVINKAIGSAIYEGDTIRKDQEVGVSVGVQDIPSTEENPSATIKKLVEKVTRGDDIIYTRSEESSSEIPNLKPGDKVQFRLVINNETISPNTGEVLPLGSLSIEDILSPDEYKKSDWKFYLTDGTTLFDANNFEIQAKLEGNKPELELLTSEWIVPELEENYSYDLKNTATLYRTINNKNKLSESSVELKIDRPSLQLLKNVVENGSIIDDSTGFTITVNGSDGSRYNVKLNSKEKCTLDNLKYGVTYTISELPVMNYKIKGIDKEELKMTEANNNTLVTVTNEKSNDKWFSDSKTTPNKIVYKSQDSTK